MCRGFLRPLVLALALAFATHSSAQTNDVSSNQPEYSVSGTVINAQTAEPVPWALVQIVFTQKEPRIVFDRQGVGRRIGIGQHAMLTDQDGRFHFEHISGERVDLTVRKPGFFSEQDVTHNWSSSQVGHPGPDMQPVVLKLLPEAVISGHVYGENGEPLEHVPVEFRRLEDRNGLGRRQRVGGASTNDEGEFRMAGLQPGSFYIAAGPATNTQLTLPGQSFGEQAYAAVYYPNANNIDDAEPIQLAAGQHVNVDFKLRAARAVRIAGQVGGYSATRNHGLQALTPSGDSCSPTGARVENSGLFTVRVLAGQPCVLKAFGQDVAGHSLTATLPIVATTDISDVHINLVPAPVLPVSVNRVRTKAEEVVVRPNANEDFPVFIHFIPDDPEAQEGSSSLEGGAQASRFAVRGIEPGRYRAEIISYGDWYVSSAFCGDTDLLSAKVTVMPGDSREIQIVLRDDAATLEGQLQADPGDFPIIVVALPDSHPLNLKSFMVDRQGHFQFSGLAPGGYKVFAFPQPSTVEYANPDVLANFAANAASVEVKPNDNASITLDVIHTK